VSRFLNKKYKGVTPYVPGEQPQDMKYIKLNTNESPFPPDPAVQQAAAEAASRLQLYPDPDLLVLREKLAGYFNGKFGTGLSRGNFMLTNGSDEALNDLFMAFCGPDRPAVFPDITYGFYKVFAEVNGVPYKEIPLQGDFTVDADALAEEEGTIFLANPNAPTGLALSRDEIERILRARPDDLLVVDEAYIDFGGESAVPLLEKYDNLVVVQTFSKSRSMAGARVGFAAAQESLIRDLDTLRNSTSPYNVNRMSMAAAEAALDHDEAVQKNVAEIKEIRESTKAALKEMGFRVTGSLGNFLFLKHDGFDGEELYEALKARGVLVRHFKKERIAKYNRVTIGSREQMREFLRILGEITGSEEETRLRNGEQR